MSTKIYNAYKLPRGKSPFEYIEPLKDAILPVRLKLDMKWIYETAIEQLDKEVFGFHSEAFETGMKIPFYDASAVILDEQSKLKRNDWKHNPHNFEVLFYEDPADREQHYAKMFYNAGEFEKPFENFVKQQGWEDFHYQNSTEQPDEISEEDWENRIGVWDRLIPDDVWASSGLSFIVQSSYGYGEAISPTFGILMDSAEKEAIDSLKTVSKDSRLHFMILGARDSDLEKDSEKRKKKFENVNIFILSRILSDIVSDFILSDEAKPYFDRMNEFSASDLCEMEYHPKTHDFSNEELVELRKSLISRYLDDSERNIDPDIEEVLREIYRIDAEDDSEGKLF